MLAMKLLHLFVATWFCVGACPRAWASAHALPAEASTASVEMLTTASGRRILLGGPRTPRLPPPSGPGPGPGPKPGPNPGPNPGSNPGGPKPGPKPGGPGGPGGSGQMMPPQRNRRAPRSSLAPTFFPRPQSPPNPVVISPPSTLPAPPAIPAPQLVFVPVPLLPAPVTTVTVTPPPVTITTVTLPTVAPSVQAEGETGDDAVAAVRSAIDDRDVDALAQILETSDDVEALAEGLRVPEDRREELLRRTPSRNDPDVVAIKGIAQALLSDPDTVFKLIDVVILSLTPEDGIFPFNLTRPIIAGNLLATFSNSTLMEDVVVSDPAQTARRKLMVDGGIDANSLYCAYCWKLAVCEETVWWCADGGNFDDEPGTEPDN